MTNSAQMLLLESLLLRAKYSDADFDSVRRALREPGSEPLRDLLLLIQDSAKPTKKASQERRSRSDMLDPLREVDPEKYDLLVTLRQQLVSRALLPTANDLRRFGLALGISSVPTRHREQGINAILRTLMVAPLEAVREARRKADGFTGPRDQSYAALADSILGRATKPES